MQLDKRQFCIAVSTYRDMLEEAEAIQNALDIGDEWKPREWINNYYELLSDICDLEVDVNYGTDLDWFCYETNFGRFKDCCKVFDPETSRTK